MIAPMFFGPGFDRSVRLIKMQDDPSSLLCCCSRSFRSRVRPFPTRLVLGLDGVAYRDMKALQAGIICTNIWGRPFRRQAFSPS